MKTTLSENRYLRIGTLCALYIAQGVPFGFAVVTLKAILAGRGLSTGEIGDILALATLPWAFKWAFGPFIDRFGIPEMGRRRPWILLAQAMMAVTIGALLLLGDLASATGTIGWLLFAHNCFNALQDVAVDALAVDLLAEDERGKANGLMYGSKYLGTVIGGAGLATIVKYAGLNAALITQVGILAAIFSLPLLLRERPGDKLLSTTFATIGEKSSGLLAGVMPIFADLRRAFSVRATLLGAGFAACAMLPQGMLGTVGATLFTKRIGWTPEFYAQIEGSAYLLGLGGSIAGGFLADWLGTKRTIIGALTLMALLWTGFALAEPWWNIDAVSIAVIYIEPVLSSVAAVGMFALFMGISWPKVGATQFTAYMALLNLGTTLGHKVAGRLDDAFDYGELYFIAAGFTLLLTVPVALIDPHQTRRLLGDGEHDAPQPATAAVAP